MSRELVGAPRQPLQGAWITVVGTLAARSADRGDRDSFCVRLPALDRACETCNEDHPRVFSLEKL